MTQTEKHIKKIFDQNSNTKHSILFPVLIQMLMRIFVSFEIKKMKI